jgi:hypothetical protein
MCVFRLNCQLYFITLPISILFESLQIELKIKEWSYKIFAKVIHFYRITTHNE